MAIYHFSTKAISRSAGRSATAAAAYRAGELVPDQRTGEAHDYRRRQGVVHREIITPEDAPAWALDRVQLWNRAEAIERRKDARVAREYELALPAELNAEQRRQLAVDFGRTLAQRYGVAMDVAIHQPHRGGDPRNHHAHLLATTRRLTPAGFGDKTDIELSDKKLRAHGKPEGRQQVEQIRKTWARLVNQALERAGVVARVDHRRLEAQGIERVPQVHLGPKVSRLEKRGLRTGQGEQARAVSQANAQLEQLGREHLGLEVQRRQEAAVQARYQQQLEQLWQEFGPGPGQPAPQAPALPQPALGQAVERAAEQSAAAAPSDSLKPQEPDPIDLAWAQFQEQNRQAPPGELEAQAAYQQLIRETEQPEQAHQAEHPRQAAERRQHGIEEAERQRAEAAAQCQRADEAAERERQVAAGRAEALKAYGAWKSDRQHPPAGEGERQGARNGYGQFVPGQQRLIMAELLAAAGAVVPQEPTAEESEHQRLEQMTAQEVAQELERLRPPPVQAVVERQPAVLMVRWEQDTLARQVQAAEAAAEQARQARVQWRQAHPWRAQAHDQGLLRSGFLIQQAQREAAHTQQARDLREQLEAAATRVKELREFAQRIVEIEQAPARARVAELEKLHQAKAAQEQAQARQAQALNETLEVFKSLVLSRNVQAHGYTDEGRHWRAAPAPLRALVEQFNHLPQEARAAELSRLRSRLERDPGELERVRGLLDQYEQTRQHNRGRRR